MADRADRLTQLLPAPAGCDVFYAPELQGYTGGDDHPVLEHALPVALGLYADGSACLLVVDEDDGSLLAADELPGFLLAAGPGEDLEHRAVDRLATRIAAKKNARPR